MRRYRPFIFSALTLATFAGIVFAAGLVFGAWDVGGSGGATPGPGPSNETTQERDGVVLKLTVDKEKYGPDDTVKVHLTIENTTKAAVDYEGKTARDPGLILTVASDLAGEQPVLAPAPAPEDLAGTLEAGGKLEREGDWDKKLSIRTTPPLAPPGRYSVTAKLLMSRAGFAEPSELAGAVTFEIEGTPYVQPPVEALKAVVADEQTKAWVQGRGDNVICAYATRDYFYNGFFTSGQAAETFDFLYKSQTDGGLPICGIATEGDAWRFVLFSPKGEEPHRLTVYVALGEPVVRRVVPGGPTPEPAPTP